MRKIGVFGHFSHNGKIPDGVARWCENVTSILEECDNNVVGVGTVGTNHRPNIQVVDQLRYFRSIPKDIDVGIIHGSYELGITTIEQLNEYKIPNIWIQPWWGFTDKIKELILSSTITIAICPPYAEELQSTYGKKVYYMPMPIDTNFWCPGDPDPQLLNYQFNKKDFNLVYVGRIGLGKNIHALIAPFRDKIIKEIPNAKLIILGPDELQLKKRVQQEIASSNLGDRIYLEDVQLSSEQVRSAIRSADVFLFPSSYETYGQSQLEAIACEAPTVTFGAEYPLAMQIPSMTWLPEYPYAAEPGNLQKHYGMDIYGQKVYGNWNQFVEMIIRIANNKQEALKATSVARKRIEETMSIPVVKKQLSNMINLACLKNKQGFIL